MFFGVRGSTPIDDPGFQKFGGHTSCVAMRLNLNPPEISTPQIVPNINIPEQKSDSQDLLLVFDTGSGAKMLSDTLRDKNMKHMHVFYGHFHLDHIIGMPFFLPAWDKETTLHYHAGLKETNDTVQGMLEKTFSPRLFPVPFKVWPHQRSYHDFIPRETFEVSQGDIKATIQTTVLNHPNGATGFRVNFQGRSACYLTDHEHHIHEFDEELSQFVEGADLVIHDASYTNEVLEHRIGWGHSSWQQTVNFAKCSHFDTLALFHHDFEHDDVFMDQVEKEAISIYPKTFAARQGTTFKLA